MPVSLKGGVACELVSLRVGVASVYGVQALLFILISL